MKLPPFEALLQFFFQVTLSLLLCLLINLVTHFICLRFSQSRSRSPLIFRFDDVDDDNDNDDGNDNEDDDDNNEDD